MFASVGLNRGVRVLKSAEQCFARIAARVSEINVADRFNGDAASHLSAFVAAHPVRYNCKPADSTEIFFTGRFDVAEVNFVLLALKATVREASMYAPSAAD